jgi:hypothetical protein
MFIDALISSAFEALASGTATLKGKVADGASAVAAVVDNSVALANAGAKALSIRVNAVEKAFVSAAGVFVSLVASGSVGFQTDGRLSLNGATASRYLAWEGGAYQFPGGNAAPLSAGQYQCSAGAGENAFRMTTAGSLLRLVHLGPFITANTGSPESVVAAPVGSLYVRTDGGAGTTLYVKESGTGNTGWVGK